MASTPSAPASAACLASPIASAGVYAVTPTTTGTRPATSVTAISATRRRSAGLWLNHSPVLPLTSTPCTPCRTYSRSSARQASSSSAPSAVNGVGAAGQ